MTNVEATTQLSGHTAPIEDEGADDLRRWCDRGQVQPLIGPMRIASRGPVAAGGGAGEGVVAVVRDRGRHPNWHLRTMHPAVPSPNRLDERRVGGDDGAGALEAFITDDGRMFPKPRFLGRGSHDGLF